MEVATAQLASSGERQFWLAEQMAPGAPALVTVQGIRLDGPCDLRMVTRALQATIQRHEALRTGFEFRDGHLWRKRPAESAPLAPVFQDGRTAAAMKELLSSPFDLAAGDLIRVGVTPDAHGATLDVVVHHVAYDGLSHELFVRDLAQAYGAQLTGHDATLPVRPRMAAHAIDASRRLKQLAYWCAELEGVADLPELDSLPPYWELAEAQVAEQELVWEPSLVQRLQANAHRQNVTPFTLLLTAYGRALADITGGDDFCVGIAVALRSGARLQEVGCEINVVPMRLRRPLSGGAVSRTWKAQSGALSHADLPLADVILATGTQRGHRLPLAQTTLIYQGWERPVHRAGPAGMRSSISTQPGTQFEAQAMVCQASEGEGWRAATQAPQCSTWADRLDELLAAFDKHLRTLAWSASQEAECHVSVGSAYPTGPPAAPQSKVEHCRSGRAAAVGGGNGRAAGTPGGAGVAGRRKAG